MKVAFTDKERVLCSPFYLCTRLWDKLDSNVQLANNVVAFKNKLNKMDLTVL